MLDTDNEIFLRGLQSKRIKETNQNYSMSRAINDIIKGVKK